MFSASNKLQLIWIKAKTFYQKIMARKFDFIEHFFANDMTVDTV